MKHVLVVEDEEHLGIGIKYNLEAEGYQVTHVADGPRAMELLEADPQAFDLVILDLMLPGMSGYAVLEGVRSSGNEVPVLILSARTLSEDRTRGFDAGADQYLMKPFDLDELLSRVRNLIARAERRSTTGSGERMVSELVGSATGAGMAETYTFDDVVVNFDTYEARVRGQTVRLTHLELKLLKYLIQSAGRVVSREELLENVWGFANAPSTRTVDNFVLRLRKFFERDPANPRHFLSVRGAGYRFLAQGT